MVNIRKPKNALKFNKPASWWGSTWREALPTGNGVIGAAVYGGAGDDVVMINHGDLWWQGHVGVLQDVADKLASVRKKLDDNSPATAQDILSGALISKNYRPLMSYPLPLCDFRISQPLDKSARDYQRILNMENGEVSVVFRDGTTKYERSTFVSRANNLVCYEITKSGNKSIDVTFSLGLHDKFNSRTPVSVSKMPDGLNVKYENFFMYFSARSDNGTDFGCVARINHFGGTQTVDPQNGITIKGAEKVLVLISPFIESQREKEWKNRKSSLTSVKLTYDKLLKEHTGLHSRLFSSAELDLEASDRDVAVDRLLDDAFVNGELPLALVEKLWAFGRFLLICGASPVTQPCPPYGLWCGDFKAPDSNIDASGPLQMMYEQIFAGNLCDYVNSIHNYYNNVLDDLKKNASRLYGCRGIMIPSVIAHGTGALGTTDPAAIHFTAAAGWVSQLFFDYYRFTGDDKFLKAKAMPFMKDVASFYEEFLKLKDGKYESSPSYSPNTTPGNWVIGNEELKIARNATVDFAVIRELLSDLVSGSKVTGMYKDEVQKWEYMLSCIPSYTTNSDGTVREYCDSEYADNDASPSAAMFYPVFPGTEVGAAYPELVRSFSLTAHKKLDTARKSFTAGSLARYANVLARTGDGDEAYDVIVKMVRSMSMQNLVFATNDWRGMGIGKEDSWATYSLEGNMGVTNAMQEMILQSTDSTIFVLPALPKDFERGSIDGFLTRTGAEISLTWNSRRGTANIKLKSRKAVTVNVKLPSGSGYKSGKLGESFDAETATVSGLKLAANKPVSLDIRF